MNEPRTNEPMPEQMLWAHVLMRAIDDLNKPTNHKDSSARWFLDEKITVRIICDAIGIDPDTLYRKIAHKLKAHEEALNGKVVLIRNRKGNFWPRCTKCNQNAANTGMQPKREIVEHENIYGYFDCQKCGKEFRMIKPIGKVA